MKKDPLGDWNPSVGDHHLNVEIEPDEWEELYFDVVGGEPDNAQGIQDSGDNFAIETKINSGSRHRFYPLLSRVSEIYRDAAYLPSEIESLYSECLHALERTDKPAALSALRKLIFCSEKAQESGSGLRLLSD